MHTSLETRDIKKKRPPKPGYYTQGRECYEIGLSTPWIIRLKQEIQITHLYKEFMSITVSWFKIINSNNTFV